MSIEAPIEREDGFFIGEDKTLNHLIVTGKPIEVDVIASPGDTSVIVKALKEALGNGDKVRFGSVVVTLTDDADAGDTSITVSALTGYIDSGTIGYKIQDITSWSFSWTLYDFPGGTAILSKTPSVGTAELGLATTTIADTDTDDLAPGKYYYVLKRTNDGSETVLSYGEVVLRRF